MTHHEYIICLFVWETKMQWLIQNLSLSYQLLTVAYSNDSIRISLLLPQVFLFDFSINRNLFFNTSRENNLCIVNWAGVFWNDIPDPMSACAKSNVIDFSIKKCKQVCGAKLSTYPYDIPITTGYRYNVIQNFITFLAGTNFSKIFKANLCEDVPFILRHSRSWCIDFLFIFNHHAKLTVITNN